MAALVQTYTKETAPITMFQTRPTSATGRMPSGQQTHQYSGSMAQSPRTATQFGATPGYRGSTPIQQYAFTSTPSLNQSNQWQGQKGSTSPAPQASPAPRSPSSSVSAGSTSKAAPERYRRTNAQASNNNHGRSQSATLPSTANLPNTSQFYGVSNNSKTALPNRPASFYATIPGGSMDDMHLHQPSQDAKTMRRRSIQSLESLTAFKPPSSEPVKVDKDAKTLRPSLPNTSVHSRSGSSESVGSSRSTHSRPSSASRASANHTSNTSSTPSEETSKQEQPKLATAPTRGSYSDALKRGHNPSPLSRPVTMSGEATEKPATPTSNLDSPAAKQLAAINQKGAKGKSKTSRLRRAFSFGSASELRKVEEENNEKKEAASKMQKKQTPEEAYESEQARIAEAQEAGGIGNSIYGGRFFGSTDNLSISSTASSASIMIRKMGRGMKKGTRSLAGLFRPKSVIGVPPPEPLAPETSQTAVSMVTVEAETQRVNVSAEPKTSDNFPHLERNSLDASQIPDMVNERLGSSGTDNSNSRKSIVGGDKERAEALAAVRKGILKRSGSPNNRGAESGLELPNVPAVSDSPNSSAPSTPNDDGQGHRRTGSIALGNEDYFMTALRLRQDTKTAPPTPHAKRNATFSPRLIFHDTWPPQEYDRRGEIATCNRLTPMLAQQIKEELNTFKMEMEVHETSKIYTHFF
ncbi:unnamed protein product [Clonostachys rosea f. rosea IK726]|uniref:Protein BNI4 n=2 Tax=Bionectria ochroleuca TaxID=29856 RepID=A0A0B7JS82_BIOOC|nr:unnamed protein product [Clonostachys rosea f. rosea IK726]